MSGDWEQRELCPDGGCTGVIGDDGRCKVCGRTVPDWIDERKRGLTPLPPESPGFDAGGDAGPSDDDEAYDDDDDEGEDDDDEALDDDPADDPAWDDRKLCSDGGCTGVIGDDGRCRVCGKAA